MLRRKQASDSRCALPDHYWNASTTFQVRTIQTPRCCHAPLRRTASELNNAFAIEVLIPAGLMAPRPANKKSSNVGRTGKRQVNEITFHSLRHTFTTWLKQSGASNALAQLIVGHDSPLVNRSACSRLGKVLETTLNSNSVRVRIQFPPDHPFPRIVR